MRLALAQINPTIGDVAGNGAIVRAFIGRARDAGADLVVFPELALSGYPPKDLLLQEGFVGACEAMARALGESASRGITVVLGTPVALPKGGAEDRTCANALRVYSDGALLAEYHKRLLPTYDVFDEDRYFVPGTRPVVIDGPSAGGPSRRIGLSICEDLWRGEDVGFAHRYLSRPDPVAELVTPQPDGGIGASIILNPSASPFVLGKDQRHLDLLVRHARRHRVHVCAVNQVGGNDELIFDGRACVIDPEGRVIAEGRAFEEDLLVVDVGSEKSEVGSKAPPPTSDARLPTSEETLFRALVLGIRDYCRKTGFKSAVLGLSGGIDSAVACVLAAAALGPANVSGVSLPSRYSSPGSKSDARALAEALGVPFSTIPIEPAFEAMLGTLRHSFAGRASDITEENLQSRIRGTLLMALSNKFGSLVLTTGNKSELAVGYCTLYGDMNGGLAVLSDVTKRWVYRLAEWINAHPADLGIPGLRGAPIPRESITKPPSAELRENQTDQDSLPPYDTLDAIIERYVEARQGVERIVRETGFEPEVVRRMVRLIDVSEYKRKQAAIGLKVTGVAFGSGRRYPIAQGWRDGGVKG